MLVAFGCCSGFLVAPTAEGSIFRHEHVERDNLLPAVVVEKDIRLTDSRAHNVDLSRRRRTTFTVCGSATRISFTSTGRSIATALLNASLNKRRSRRCWSRAFLQRAARLSERAQRSRTGVRLLLSQKGRLLSTSAFPSISRSMLLG